MANYATLKSAIEQVIKTNGNKEITGALLQQSLLAMINSLGAGYQFVGIATPTTNPGTPDYNVFYIASTAGTYSNFPDSNNVPLVLNDGEIAILKYNGTWTKDVTGAATAEKVTQLVQDVNEIKPEIFGGSTFITQTLDLNGPNKYYNTGDPVGTTAATYEGEGLYCTNIQVNPGDTFKLFGIGGQYSLRLYAFANSNDENIGRAENNLDASNGVVVVAPAGATRMVVNFKNYNSETDKVQKLEPIPGLKETVSALSNKISEQEFEIANLDTTINPIISNPLNGVTFPESTPQAVREAITKMWISSSDPTNIEKVIANAPKLYLSSINNETGNYRPLIAISPTDTGDASDQAFSGYLASQDTPRSVKEVFPCLVRNPYQTNWNLGIQDTKINIEIDWSKISGTYSLHIEIETAKLNTENVNRVTLRDVSPEIINKSISGKQIVCFGDSLTEMKDNVNGKSYPEYIAKFSGADVVNVGIGGSQLRRRSLFFKVFDPAESYQATFGNCIYTDPVTGETRLYNFTSDHQGPWNYDDVRLHPYQQLAYSNMDVCGLIYAASVQDYEDVIAACKVVKETQSDDNTDIINRFVAIDWSNVDAITIFAGTNDWYNANTLGTTGSSDPNKTLGAINEIVRMFLTAYPHIRIYWYTPIVRWLAYNNGSTNDAMFSDNYSVEGNGTLKEECAAIIQEVTKNHLPVCDMYNNFGWNKYNCTEFFVGTDGTHPRTQKGVTYLATAILNFLIGNKNF